MTDFEQSLRGQLRARESALDPAIETRLRNARNRACNQADSAVSPRLWLPVTGMTLASIIAFAVIFLPLPGHKNSGSGGFSPDTAQTQDLDFYYWLAETQDSPGS